MDGMTQQLINVGTVGNDGTGDTARLAWQKGNSNFTDLYTQLAAYGTAYVGTFVATAGQTVFTLPLSPGTVANLQISVDGAMMVPGLDYYWTTPVTVTFYVGLTVGQTVLYRYNSYVTIGTMTAGGGISGQLLYNNAGIVNGTTIGGDATLVATTGALTVTKTAGVAFAASATTNTTVTGNINYTQGGTGATSRTVTNKLQESVSVKDFGAVGDGVTDDTAAIVAALAANPNVTIPAGATCKISGITMPANSSIGCKNGRASITLTNTELTAITIATNDVTVYGLNFNGGSVQTYQGGGTSAGAGYGITISGAAGAVYNVTVKDCDLINFDNTAINVGTVEAATSYGKSVNFSNVRAHANRTNWFFGSNAEYCEITNCYGTLGMYGVRLGGGNNKFANSNFTNNYYNSYLENATNPQHGGFYGCSFNHAGLRSLYATGVSLGMEFVGCKFWYGSIEIVNCNGIRICNSQLASSASVLIVDGTSGGINWIHDNMIFGTYTKTFTVPKLYWARNQLVGDYAATTKDDFVPNYYVRQHLTTPSNLVSAAAPGTFCGLTVDEGWLHGITDTTNTVGSGFFKFPESGLYQISGRFNVKPHAGAAEQLVTVTLRVVNGAVAEQSKFVVTRTMSATATGEDLTFCDTFMAQAGWFLGIYVNTSLGANGLDTQSADILVQSLA
jgi:hypothetical protein